MAKSLVLVTLLFLPREGRAQFQPEMPEQLALVDFYLLTVGWGPAIHQNYGHTILRVVDWGANLDMNFNWGLFDFGKPGFIKNFYRGRLRYQLGIQSYRSVVEHYTMEGRSVVQDRIFLTETQKRRLMAKLIWNAKPENRDYDYHMYYDNCSTRPRDYLDEVLGGAIRSAYDQQPAGQTFRDIFRYSMAQSPLVVFGADVTHNSVGDIPLSKWQEMFLPAKLRQHLLQLPGIGDDGSALAGQKLLYDTKVLLDAPEPKLAIDPYLVFLVLFLLPLCWIQVLLLAGFRGEPGPLLEMGMRLLGLVTMGYGLIAGIFGLLMTSNWLFSGHEMLWHNANLWLLWPTDLWLLYPAAALLRKGHRTRALAGTTGKILAAYGVLHLGAMGLFIVLYLSGQIVQNVGKVLVFIQPAGFLIWALLLISWRLKARTDAQFDRQREKLPSL